MEKGLQEEVVQLSRRKPRWLGIVAFIGIVHIVLFQGDQYYNHSWNRELHQEESSMMSVVDNVGPARDDEEEVATTDLQTITSTTSNNNHNNTPTSSSTRNHHRHHVKFYEIATEIMSKIDLTDESKKYAVSSSYRAKIVNSTTTTTTPPWFIKRKMCKETCCVETVATSLRQDKYKISSFEDGRDLSDLKIDSRNHDNFVPVHSQNLHQDMLPCLLPGTIIFIVSDHNGILNFWNGMRPKIQVPYVAFLSGTDQNMPGPNNQFLDKDPLLLKMYGNNPKRGSSHPKFQRIHLGLSMEFNQERLLQPYLEYNQYTNPFVDTNDGYSFKQQYNLTEHPIDFDIDVYVNFGLKDKAPRQVLWNVICNNTTSTKGSCTRYKKRRPPQLLYIDASRHRFAVSPVGWGWDCYRTWELLLLGIIPIIEDRPEGYPLFEGLPVVHMKDMMKATSKQDFITAIQQYIGSDAFQKATFETGWERLFQHYRRRQLLQDSGRDKEILVDENGDEYYQAYHYSVTSGKPLPTNEDFICRITEERCNRIDTSTWMKHPIPEVTEADKEWLATWENYGESSRVATK